MLGNAIINRLKRRLLSTAVVLVTLGVVFFANAADLAGGSFPDQAT